MWIETNGIRMRVRSQGQPVPGGVALVFLHYWGGSSRTWDAVRTALPPDMDSHAVDLRGWGESERPASGYAMADLADDVAGALQVLGPACYVLVGHSMGGKVAQLLAARRPSGLQGLVLVAPAPPVPMALPAEQRAAMEHVYDNAASIEAVLDQVLTARPIAPALRRQVIADSLRGAPAARAAWPQVGMLEDISRQVEAIAVPTLVLAGQADQVERIDTLQRELLPRIPGARLQVLPGVGHLAPLEAPAEVAAALLGFVEACTTGN